MFCLKTRGGKNPKGP